MNKQLRVRPGFLVAVAFLGLAATSFALNIVGFWGSEVCTKCGKESRYREWHWQYDGPRLLLISRDEQETPLSRFIATNSLVRNCPHDWCFASGGNYPVFTMATSCALGRGREVRSTALNTNVVAFLDEHRRRGDTNAVALWLTRFLDPKATRNANWSIVMYRVAEGSTSERLEEAESEFRQRAAATR